METYITSKTYILDTTAGTLKWESYRVYEQLKLIAGPKRDDNFQAYTECEVVNDGTDTPRLRASLCNGDSILTDRLVGCEYYDPHDIPKEFTQIVFRTQDSRYFFVNPYEESICGGMFLQIPKHYDNIRFTEDGCLYIEMQGGQFMSAPVTGWSTYDLVSDIINICAGYTEDNTVKRRTQGSIKSAWQMLKDHADWLILKGMDKRYMEDVLALVTRQQAGGNIELEEYILDAIRTEE